MPIPLVTTPSEAALEAMFKDQRREERIPLPVDVELRRQHDNGGLPCCAVLRNMSEHGVCLDHSFRLQVDELVTITLLDIPVDLPCEYRVSILWQKENATGEFTSGGRIVADS